MLVVVAEQVEVTKSVWRIASPLLVRLVALHERPGLLAHVLLDRARVELGAALREREEDAGRIGLGCVEPDAFNGFLPGEMVERGTKVVDNLAP
jgi:hypothetical protein